MTDTTAAQPRPLDPLVELAAEIVAAYAGHNAVSPADLGKLIGEVHGALAVLGAPAVPPKADPLVPALPPRSAVTADSIGCLCCGQRFKSIKRHLMTSHNLTPDAYRQMWGLKPDYPMVAPVYSTLRSGLAKAAGLGQSRARAAVN